MWWNSMTVFQQAMFIIACAASLFLIIQIILMLISGASDSDISGGGVSDADASDVGGGGITDYDGGGVSDFDGGMGGAFDGNSDISGSLSSALDGGISDAAVGGNADAELSSDGATHGATMPFGLRLLSLRSIIAFITIGSWVGYTLCYTALPLWGVIIIAVACGFAAACCMAGALIGMEKLQGNGNLNPANAIGKVGTVYLTIPPHRTGFGKVNVLIQERYAEYDAVTNSNEPIPTSAEIKVIGHTGANVLLVEKYKKPSIVIENQK